ncbi:hypothetical protein J6590_012926 [Homalodisca vitripennis]|nr:hypothetical protein J6590_012926 [Homalodisca vitripennis]
MCQKQESHTTVDVPTNRIKTRANVRGVEDQQYKKRIRAFACRGEPSQADFLSALQRIRQYLLLKISVRFFIGKQYSNNDLKSKNVLSLEGGADYKFPVCPPVSRPHHSDLVMMREKPPSQEVTRSEKLGLRCVLGWAGEVSNGEVSYLA